jgi:hypothetical protein
MSSRKPAPIDAQPPSMPLKTNTAPSAIRNSDVEPMIGQGIGAGTA